MLADDVRAALAASEDRGAIAVRYETRACELRLEVLSGCGGEGSRYDYRSGVQEVTVRANDLVHGLGGAEKKVRLPDR